MMESFSRNTCLSFIFYVIWLLLYISCVHTANLEAPLFKPCSLFGLNTKCLCHKSDAICENVPVESLKITKDIHLRSLSLKSIQGRNGITSDSFRNPGFGTLEVLNITQCMGDTAIDWQFINHLPRLRLLKVSNCNMKRFPKFLNSHSTLEVLILNSNGLTHMDGSSLSNLPNLRHLELNNNKLQDIAPKWIPMHNKIEHLSLNGNQLTGLDPGLQPRLVRLKVLRLNRNRFSFLRTTPKDGVAGSVPRVPRIGLKHSKSKARKAMFAQEGKSGVLPTLPQLEILELSRNRITGVDQVLLRLFTRLRVVHLRRNDLQMEKMGTGAFYIAGPGLEKLDLSGNPGLSVVMAKWTYGLKNLKELRLRRCGLSRVDANSLEELSQLEVLDLGDNRISSVDRRVFRALSRLLVLEMDENRLAELPQGLFVGLTRLRRLSFRENRLRSLQSEDPGQVVMPQADAPASLGGLIGASNGPRSSLDLLKPEPVPPKTDSRRPKPHRGVGLLKGLESLQRLDLSQNQLTVLHTRDLSGVETALEELDLRGNQLIRVDLAALVNLERLRVLHLDSSHVQCDCGLSGLVDWLRGKALNINATCGRPESLQGRSLLSLSTTELRAGPTCPSGLSTEPVLSLTSNAARTETKPGQEGTLWVLEGGNLTLRCDVTLTEEARPLIGWERLVASSGALPGEMRLRTESVHVDGTRVKSEDLPVTLHELESALPAGSPDERGVTKRRVWSSLLVVQAVAIGDEGGYRCTGESKLGVGQSNVERINVYSAPQFTSTPPSVISAMERDTVEIRCGAAGRPSPSTALRKTGGSDFPAAKSRRMSVYRDDSHFFITNVRREDAGEYVCQSVNAAGRIALTFTLKVNTPAHFTSTPSSRQRARVGSAWVVRVEVDGIPGPRVDWFKSGRSVNASSRLHVSGDGRMLVISRVRAGDAGVYTVKIFNALGKQAVNVTLDVETSEGLVYPGSEYRNEEEGMQPPTEEGDEVSRWLTTHWIGVTIIAAVLCIVLTSLIWVLVLCCLSWRKKEAHTVTKVTPPPSCLSPYENPRLLAPLMHGEVTSIPRSVYTGQNTSDYNSGESCDSANSPHNDIGTATRPLPSHLSCDNILSQSRRTTGSMSFSSVPRSRTVEFVGGYRDPPLLWHSGSSAKLMTGPSRNEPYT